jgi:probable phosphoglycerate mutase
MLELRPRGAATRLVLVRHAETEERARGLCVGRLDVPLGKPGRRQAEQLSTALAEPPLAAVYTSPLARARDTAGPIAAAHGLEPVVVPQFVELDFGELEGLPFEQIEAERPALFRGWMETPDEVRFPGGESLADLQARVLPVVAALRARHDGGEVGLVAHAGVLRVVLADALGLAGSAVFRLDQSPGGVSVVDWFGESPVVRVVNTLARP